MNTEYPKYWECNGLVIRSLTGNHLQKFTAGHWEDGAILCCGCEPITPQRAFELTGDKELLENQTCLAHGKKMSEHNCLEQLRKAQKILEKGGEARPVGIAQLTEAASKLPASPPQWIPVSERLPKEAVFVPVMVEGWSRITVAALTYGGGWIFCEEEKHPKSITHWMDIPPYPPKPQTQAEKDEEWIAKQLSSFAPDERMIYKLAARETLAYVRGEKGEK